MLKFCKKAFSGQNFLHLSPSYRFNKQRVASKSSDYFFQKVNPNVLKAQYAVRGLVPTTALQIQSQLITNPGKHPFQRVTFCSIGNPQDLGMPPITFARQVAACLCDPRLIQRQDYNVDARKRAKKLLDQIRTVGAYTQSLGIPSIRQAVARYIAKNDDVSKPNINDIYLTSGASQGAGYILNLLISDPKDAIMISVPEYPLYSSCIFLAGGNIAPFYLDEQAGWQLDENELEKAYQKGKQQGYNIKGMVLINPGNPSGVILNEETIHKVIKFAVSKRIVIIADEVYRENLEEASKYASFRKALGHMDESINAQCELVSLHSCSKGTMGQCGFRAGYMYLHNIKQEIKDQLTKVKSINLCSNAVGQAMVEIMCNPPIQGVTPQTRSLYLKERNGKIEGFKRKAGIVSNFLNKMKNITCVPIKGATYDAFPQVRLSPKALAAAQKAGYFPDVFFCLELLKNTGIVVVPGSGFRQKEGTYHFRFTSLFLDDQRLMDVLNRFNEFNNEFHAKYE